MRHQNLLKLSEGLPWDVYCQADMEEWTDNKEYQSETKYRENRFYVGSPMCSVITVVPGIHRARVSSEVSK